MERKHIFHIVSDDFPLPEEGIIGLPYSQRYGRYSVTKEYLFLDKVKLPLHDNGEYICQNTIQVRKIDVPIEEREVWIEDQNMIPDGIYTIMNSQRTPHQMYRKWPYDKKL